MPYCSQKPKKKRVKFQPDPPENDVKKAYFCDSVTGTFACARISTSCGGKQKPKSKHRNKRCQCKHAFALRLGLVWRAHTAAATTTRLERSHSATYDTFNAQLLHISHLSSTKNVMQGKEHNAARMPALYRPSA